MHCALEIPEILLNIFVYHHPSVTFSDNCGTLAGLARTCRSFKEPALDLLWRELDNPSPLARCLPDAYHHWEILPKIECYSFSRSLTQTEWRILRSYARRILSIRHRGHVLDWESVMSFLNPPPTEPLLPNLRHLEEAGLLAPYTKYLLSIPFPSLNSLYITLEDLAHLQSWQAPLELFCNSHQNARMLSLHLDAKHAFLDMNALANLSRLPALASLSCKLSTNLLNQIPLFDSLLSFPNLHRFTLHSDCLKLVQSLLSRIRLPAVTDFTVDNSYYLREEFLSFWDSVRVSGIGHTVQGLSLRTHLWSDRFHLAGLALHFEDLRPCMAFSNLRRIDLNIGWKVDLADNELLELAPSWPRLTHFCINTWWGWKTQYGITPGGLVQFLQTCSSLSQIAIVMDTRGYTEFAPSSTILGFTLPLEFSINVLDSDIELQSVPAMAAFFASIMPWPDFSFYAWSGPKIRKSVHRDRWEKVYMLATEAIRQRS